MFPFNETSCVMKTGNSLFKHNRHDRISKDEAPVESLLCYKYSAVYK